jgi:hypothetical protein
MTRVFRSDAFKVSAWSIAIFALGYGIFLLDRATHRLWIIGAMPLVTVFMLMCLQASIGKAMPKYYWGFLWLLVIGHAIYTIVVIWLPLMQGRMPE